MALESTRIHLGHLTLTALPIVAPGRFRGFDFPSRFSHLTSTRRLLSLRAMEAATKQIVVREIPVDLWKKFRLQALANDQTVQAAVVQALAKYVEAA